jgi:hypothetical protein
MGSISPARIVQPIIFTNKLLGCLAILFILGIAGCKTAETPKAESPPLAVVQSEPTLRADLSPPELAQVRDAVKRIFKNNVEIDSTHKPFFVDGDFNGDSSQDLAVVITPVSEQLAELNQEFPTWILKDPFSPHTPQIPRLRVTAHDRLLAVIHGFGEKGWRDSQATQTFLLKNAAGSEMVTRSAKDLPRTQNKRIPYLRGDVIGTVVAGNAGYLYFADATYSWYDPKTFKSETDTGVAHMRVRKKAE